MKILLGGPILKNCLILILVALSFAGCQDTEQAFQNEINLSGKGLTEIPPEVLSNKKLKGLGLGPKGFMVYGNLSALPDSPNYITAIPEEV